MHHLISSQNFSLCVLFTIVSTEAQGSSSGRMMLNSIKFLSSLVLVATTLVMSICFYYSSVPLARIHFSTFTSTNPNQDGKHRELQKVLRRAAMADNTVIVTTVNGAWPETEAMLELFAESLRNGDGTEHLFRHLLVVAMDLRALAMCKSLHVFDHCLYLESILIVSRDLLKNKMMKLGRIYLLSSVLDLGYSFIFTDLDVMWLRNPLRQFSPSAHLTISSDYYNGNSWDMNNLGNTAFFYVKSNAITIEFFKYWYMSSTLYPGLSDNALFNKIKTGAFVQELGIEISYLGTEYFGGFCQLSEDVRKLCTVHANCCAGLEDKLHDLRALVEDWRKYRNGSVEMGGFKWRVPLKCHL